MEFLEFLKGWFCEFEIRQFLSVHSEANHHLFMDGAGGRGVTPAKAARERDYLMGFITERGLG